MKKYNAPSLKVKEFSRVSILTDSVTGTNNVDKAKEALKGLNIEEKNIKTITL